jgi:hypothetical protein
MENARRRLAIAASDGEQASQRRFLRKSGGVSVEHE